MDEDERRWLFETPPQGDDAEPVALASRDDRAESEDGRDEMVESVSEPPDDE